MSSTTTPGLRGARNAVSHSAVTSSGRLGTSSTATPRSVRRREGLGVLQADDLPVDRQRAVAGLRAQHLEAAAVLEALADGGPRGAGRVERPASGRVLPAR